MSPVLVTPALDDTSPVIGWCVIDGRAIDIGLPHTQVHYLFNGGQPCIHGPATFPRACLFDRRFVAGLNFQAIFYDRQPVPVIASRHRNGLVTVAINSRHPIKPSCRMPRCLNAKCQWIYQMREMQWADQDHPDTTLWLGIWPDTGDPAGRIT